MGRFVKGEVVILPFPFSDLSASKRRPAVVLASLPGDDVILCMITSRNVRDPSSIALAGSDFKSGGLLQPSNIRPNRIFSADSQIIVRSVGILSHMKMQEVVTAVVRIITS